MKHVAVVFRHTVTCVGLGQKQCLVGWVYRAGTY